MADCPDIEFNYDDADLQENEMAELYSYTEGPEFQLNLKVRRCSRNAERSLQSEVYIFALFFYSFAK